MTGSDFSRRMGLPRALPPSVSAPTPTSTMTPTLLPSASLPGAISIDPAMRYLASRASMTVTDNAVSLLVVAVREHARKILQGAIAEAKVGDQLLVSARGDHWTSLSRRTAKSLITVHDLARALEGDPTLGGGGRKVAPTSRLAWERCVASANSGVAALSSSLHPTATAAAAQAGINRAIEAAAALAVSSQGRGTADSIAAARLGHTSAAASDGRRTPLQRQNSAQLSRRGTGKDLSVMKARTTTTSSSSSASNTVRRRTVAAAVSKTEQQNGEHTKPMSAAVPSSQAEPTRDPNTSAHSRRVVGRGFGAKNLAMMRARRQSGCSSPDSTAESTSSRHKEEKAAAVEPVKME